MSHVWHYIANLTLDDFNKIILALVALIALFLGPHMQFKIAKRQVQMQADIAKQQIETQQQIARRQVADSISSRRQVWIDELRKDAAEFLTLFARLAELRRPTAELSIEDQGKNFDEMAAANARAHELGIRIKLRLNPTEDDHNKLDELLGKLSAVSNDPPPNETTEQKNEAMAAFQVARTKVISHVQFILKKEWERVKRGDL
ncbi:MAG TPA: hypothetical protein DCP03_07660 [Polaromonas sp.]|uniref:hypothetical protein n=1 Tax=Polaromonas sp. UBA4122 TaxID=1947074 RepID=UPI000ED1BDE3|nr:hypothetical protein [Polaromonas sp. UBA4122]HAL37987.1 hypothetical protein [Polaromonas sp.]